MNTKSDIRAFLSILWESYRADYDFPLWRALTWRAIGRRICPGSIRDHLVFFSVALTLLCIPIVKSTLSSLLRTILYLLFLNNSKIATWHYIEFLFIWCLYWWVWLVYLRELHLNARCSTCIYTCLFKWLQLWGLDAFQRWESFAVYWKLMWLRLYMLWRLFNWCYWYGGLRLVWNNLLLWEKRLLKDWTQVWLGASCRWRLIFQNYCNLLNRTRRFSIACKIKDFLWNIFSSLRYLKLLRDEHLHWPLLIFLFLINLALKCDHIASVILLCLCYVELLKAEGLYVLDPSFLQGIFHLHRDISLLLLRFLVNKFILIEAVLVIIRIVILLIVSLHLVWWICSRLLLWRRLWESARCL